MFTTHLSANYGQQWETGVQDLPPGCRVPRDNYAGVRMLQVSQSCLGLKEEHLMPCGLCTSRTSLPYYLLLSAAAATPLAADPTSAAAAAHAASPRSPPPPPPPPHAAYALLCRCWSLQPLCEPAAPAVLLPWWEGT